MQTEKTSTYELLDEAHQTILTGPANKTEQAALVIINIATTELKDKNLQPVQLTTIRQALMTVTDPKYKKKIASLLIQADNLEKSQKIQKPDTLDLKLKNSRTDAALYILKRQKP